jgi:hypothetical protein
MAPKFKMEAKTFLSFKTCKYDYFFKFLQDCLNLTYFSSLTKKNYQKNSKWPKNSWFFGSGTTKWSVLVFGYVILLTLFTVTKIMSVVKNQNGSSIQDGVEKFYIFHPTFIFLCFFIFWVKIKLLWKTFSWKFKFKIQYERCHFSKTVKILF